MELDKEQNRLLDTVADHGEDIADLVQAQEGFAREIYQGVLTGVEYSDPELFRELGIEPELTIKDLLSVPLADRGMEWAYAFSGLIVAARITAFALTQGIDFLKHSEKHEARVTRILKPMSRAAIRAAGKVGVRKDRRDAAKTRRRAS